MGVYDVNDLNFHNNADFKKATSHLMHMVVLFLLILILIS